MDFDTSDFKLNELTNICKGHIENNFFKFSVNETDYVILIHRIRASLLEVTVFNRNQLVNINNPIEHEILVCNEEFGKKTIDFFDDEKYIYRPFLESILEDYLFELSEINHAGIDFIKSLYLNDELIGLISENVKFKNLENPSNRFERKFSSFIHEICLRIINDNEDLQVKLIEKKKRKENEQKKLEEHMKKVKEREQKIQKFNDEMPTYPSKNSSSYNIRW